MTTGVLYWRLKDEQTGKWSYKKVDICEEVELPGDYVKIIIYQGEEE